MSADAAPPLAPSSESGDLGVLHLKRVWSAALGQRSGTFRPREGEAVLDSMVVHGLGLGLHQAFEHLHQNAPTFGEFEQWIVAVAGAPDALRVARLNAAIEGRPAPASVRAWLDCVEASAPVLSADQLRRWEEEGYVVLEDAVSEPARAAAEAAIWKHVDADPDAPESWYASTGRHRIMVELIQHAALEANRRSPRIHKAFAQLWGTADLWATTDRCGFHPPQRAGHPFPGPDLHWDSDLSRPHAFGTQGILYLTDTPPEQGALTLVPGFHRRLPAWLAALPDGTDPHTQDLHALGSVAIGAGAGDMVIWRDALPHGSRPNLGTRPRIVQYINLFAATR